MNNNIYTAYLGGGLGNQMFQIAHAICQSWKHSKIAAFLPITNDSYPPDWKPSNFLNNIYRNVNFLDKIENTIRVEEKEFAYNELVFDLNNSVEFYGYFQSSKNFLGYDDDIKNLFSPTNEFINKANNLYPELNSNSVSVNIRLGDYRNVPNVLPIIDKSYIDYCINDIGDYDNIFIFSNEKDWAINNLNYKNSIIVDGLTNYEEMWLMSLCKHNIISNSTFSWWGSFLNKNASKKVYAPNIWFGPAGPVIHNIYESNWNIIDVENQHGILIKK